MGYFKQNDEKVNKAKKVKRKTVRNTKPDGFQDIEKMAKDLLNAKGINYYGGYMSVMKRSFWKR